MTTSNKTNDTRQQLRNLMQQHTATTYPQTSPVAPKPQPIVPSPIVPSAAAPTTPTYAPAPQVAAISSTFKSIDRGDRCTIRLSAQELDKVNRIILETHQQTGERITTSDVLRIGLARVGGVGENSPVTTEQIAALRATDRRRR